MRTTRLGGSAIRDGPRRERSAPSRLREGGRVEPSAGGRREFLISKALDPGRRPRRAVRLLRPRPARVPDLHGASAGAGARRRPERAALFTGNDISRRPAGVPEQRPDGVRVGVRARRLPRPRLHRRLPAARVRPRPARRTAARRRTPPRAGRSTDFRTNRYDAKTGTLTVQRARRRRRSAGSSATTAASSPTRRPSTGCAERDHRPDAASPADRVLRVDGVGGRGEAARPQLLVHEQLAARSRASTTSRPRT